MENKFLEILDNPILNTSSVIRYSLMFQSNPEDLSKHITDVALMSYIISNNLITEFNEDIDIGEVLEKAIVHDVDEVLTGDIVRTTKYHTDEIHSGLEKLADDSVQSISHKIMKSDRMYHSWKTAKDGKTGCIVKLVDMLSVSRKSFVEVKLLGNNYFQKVCYEMTGNLDSLIDYLNSEDLGFNDDSLNYLLKLLEDAKGLMSECIDDTVVSDYGVLYGVMTKYVGR